MEKKRSSAVAIWLLIGVGMIVIQVLLGGITRLTGSGLSITEWKPILGVIPPMNDEAWQKAFDQYKQIGQYKHLNFDFTLGDFKFIYFWEWFHRVWARFMGLVFLIGFIYFLVTRRFKKEMILPMVLLFLLGALQGAIGWIMVKSGHWQSTELAFNMEDSSKIAKKPLKPTFLHTRHILLGGKCRDDLRPQNPKKILWETTK
jgi:cytochrome c oxidase assembly protein subunit 15